MGHASDLMGNRRMTRSMAASSLTSTGTTTKTESTIFEETASLVPRPQKRRRVVSKTKKTKSLTKAADSPTKDKALPRAPPSLSSPTFGLVQERIADNLYHIVLQAILWNQTTGKQARPVFEQLIAQYPSPTSLAKASLPALTALLQPIGLHNIRAARCIALGQRWREYPPCAEKRYVRKGYPVQGSSQLGDGEEPGWEIAHLPGVGPYALDSYRIFHRDKLRGLALDWLGDGAPQGFEPEWKRVVPTDKELRAYLKWMWKKEGWEWDELSGKRKRNQEKERKAQSIQDIVDREQVEDFII